MPIPTVLPSDAPGDRSSIVSEVSSTPGRCLGDGAQSEGIVCGFPSLDPKLKLDWVLGFGQLQSTIPTNILSTTSKGLVSTAFDDRFADLEHTSTERVHIMESNLQTPLKESPKKPLPTSQIVYIKPLPNPPIKGGKNKEVLLPSNGPVASFKGNERRDENSNSSRIFYISLLTQPTKASKPSEGS